MITTVIKMITLFKYTTTTLPQIMKIYLFDKCWYDSPVTIWIDITNVSQNSFDMIIWRNNGVYTVQQSNEDENAKTIIKQYK